MAVDLNMQVLIVDDYKTMLRIISNLLKQVHAGLPHVLQQLPGHPAFAKLTDANKKSLERAISS